MLSDHLGSTSALVAQNGALVSTNYYHPYGDARSPLSPLTTKRFTGQYHEAALGLYFYNARWYDPLLGRFTQADTLIPSPGNPQAFNRYAYTLNNPLRYTDPSGHMRMEPPGGGGGNGGVTPPPPWNPPHWPSPPPQPTPQPLGWPTATPTVTPGPQLLPPFTPTPGPLLGPATPLPPTPTPIPLGEINIPDAYWTISTWLVYELPQMLLEDGPTVVRTGGRALGNLNPSIAAVGWVASIGPNLADHILSGDSGTEIATDMVVDTIGWGISQGGAAVGTAAGAAIGTLEIPVVGTISLGVVGNITGSLLTSVGYDVYVGPRIRPYVRNIFDFIMDH